MACDAATVLLSKPIQINPLIKVKTSVLSPSKTCNPPFPLKRLKENKPPLVSFFGGWENIFGMTRGQTTIAKRLVT